MSASKTPLKPLNRVLAYLEQEIPATQKRQGNRLPTTREVARLIDVSPATVRNAYQLLAKKGLVQVDTGSGSFWTDLAEVKNGKNELIIGINIPHFPTTQKGDWIHRIFGGLLYATLDRDYSLRFQPVRVIRENKVVGNRDELSRQLHGMNGFILFPSFSNEQLNALLEEHSIPHVSLNPLSVTSTTGFVSSDYFYANCKVGQAFNRSKRKRPLLFLSPGTEYSVSCQLRLAGFLSGLHLGDCVPDFRKLIAPKGDFTVACDVFANFLNQGWIPDAVCTAGNDMAHAVMEVATQYGIRIPEDMSIVSGNGIVDFANNEQSVLTSMIQPLERIGEELVDMLHKTMRAPDENIPGINFPMSFSIGETTLPEENVFLQLKKM